MEVLELLRWAQRDPFEPFEVVLQRGTRVPVNHPEEIFFLPNPARVQDIHVYSEGDHFVFGPSAVTAIHRVRTTDPY